MIFVTVGTQLPFDRLLQSVENWASKNPNQRIVAQTGETCFTSPRFEAEPFVDAIRFRALVEEAEIVVAHAGMGSILTAIELAKPVILMPRRADLGEHRNDHQRATADKLSHLSNLTVVESAEALAGAMDRQLNTRAQKLGGDVVSNARRQLIGEIRSFIHTNAFGSAAMQGAA